MSDLGTKALSPGIFQHLSDFMLGVKPLTEILPLKFPISSPEGNNSGISDCILYHRATLFYQLRLFIVLV